MAYSKLGIFNLALFHIKQKKIATLGESTAMYEACNDVYEYVLKEVLERHDWKFALKEEELTRDELYVSTGAWDYRYNKPAEECLRISRVRDEDDIEVSYEDMGDYLYSDHDNNLGDAIAEDDMSADNTADWTDDGASISLAFDTDHYEVTTSAVNQNTWIADLSVEAGRSYKAQVYLKNGTASSKKVELYFYDGVAQYSDEFTSTGIETPISWTFKCANTTDAAKIGIRVVDSLAASNLELTAFTVYDGGQAPAYMKFVTYAEDPTKYTAQFVNTVGYRLAAAVANRLAPDMETDMLQKYEVTLLQAIAHDQSRVYIEDDKGNDDWLTAGRN